MSTLIQLILSGILVGSVYALMSIGLTLIFGVLRIVNFAHGEFLMIAMYGAWAFTHLFGLNPYIAAVAIVPGDVPVRRCRVLARHQSGAGQAASGGGVRDHGTVDLPAERSADGDDRGPARHSADLQPVDRDRINPSQGRAAAGFCDHSPLHFRAAMDDPQNLSRQGDPGHGAGRRGRDADGHSGAAYLSHYICGRIGIGGSCGLRDGAAVFGVSVGRPELRADRVPSSLCSAEWGASRAR